MSLNRYYYQVNPLKIETTIKTKVPGVFTSPIKSVATTGTKEH